MLTLTVDVQVGAEAKALLVLACNVYSRGWSLTRLKNVQRGSGYIYLTIGEISACNVAGSLGDMSRYSGTVIESRIAVGAFLRTSDKIQLRVGKAAGTCT